MMRISTRLGSALILCASLAAGLAGCEQPGGTNDDSDGDGDESGGPSADDIDGDAIRNALDEDMDGDGIKNIDESDPDGDIDGDGIRNGQDDAPYGEGSNHIGPWGDLDGDGLPNVFDSDDDGDSIPDGVLGAGSCDGITTAASENADCDGYCISDEAGLTPCDDGAPPGSGQPDTDGDGIPDSIDTDDDGDGIPDDDDDNNNGIDPVPPGSSECITTDFATGDAIEDPRVLLVVDTSGSMNWRFGSSSANEPPCRPSDTNCVSKWKTTQEVLGAVVDGLDSTVEFGLMTYPVGDVCGEGSLRVPVRPDNADNVMNQLNLIPEGEGGTPTAVTLAEARRVLRDLPAQGGTRAVVLATDGGPNCNGALNGDTCRCVDPNSQYCRDFSENCLDDVNTIGAAAQLNAAGFPVFVIGISGAENFADVLNALANAGGTGTAYSAQSGSALAEALEQIAIRVGACRFDLPADVSPASLTVTVDGQPVERDTRRQNGWDLVDANTVELFGVACERAVSGGAGAGVVSIQTCLE